MKYSTQMQIVQVAPGLLRNEEAARWVAGSQNLKTLVTAGWVRPIIQHSGCTAYRLKDLEAAIERASNEGWPKQQKGE